MIHLKKTKKNIQYEGNLSWLNAVLSARQHQPNVKKKITKITIIIIIIIHTYIQEQKIKIMESNIQNFKDKYNIYN